MFSLLVVLRVTGSFISSNDCVHGIDLGLVHFTGLVPFKLERWCECVVINRELLAGNMDSFGFLET